LSAVLHWSHEPRAMTEGKVAAGVVKLAGST